jgi:hypothetical protein
VESWRFGHSGCSVSGLGAFTAFYMGDFPAHAYLRHFLSRGAGIDYRGMGMDTDDDFHGMSGWGDHGSYYLVHPSTPTGCMTVMRPGSMI